MANLNNSDKGDGTSDAADVRYPGAARMLLIWTVAGALTVARYQLSFGSFGSPQVGHEAFVDFLACTSWFFPWAALTPLVFRMERKLPLGVSGWPRHAALLGAISVPFCLAASPVMMGIFAAIRYAFGSPADFSAGVRFWVGAFPSAECIFWCSVAGGYFLRTVFQLHEEERRAARLALEKSTLEASLNQAQLEALRARLNPHFLFNSLQNISALTKENPHTASRMLAVLGDLLRAVLRRNSQPECTLGEEIDLTRSYVALEQMRFADRLRVTFEIPDNVTQAMVPCFLMQPLLENAIIHGLPGVRKTGVIAVRATMVENRLVITVADNGAGPPSETSGMKIGVGLGSTSERLTKMYGERHQFSIGQPADAGAEVRISIPLCFADCASLHEEIPAVNR